jgi:type IX secretion system PorP/SprF family membrane protein
MNVKLAVKNSIKIYIWILLLGVGVARAQDPQFSQYYANPIYTNPAFAGGSYVGRMSLNYRSQWPSITGSYRTFSASYDEHFNSLSGGIGFIVTNDEAGVGTLRSISASFIYSYQIILSKSLTMRAGIQAGFCQKTIDFSKLTFLDQIVARQGIIVPVTGETPKNGPVFYPNFAAGGVIYSKKFYAGFAIHNLNQPSQGFYKSTASDSKIDMRYTAHGGLVIPVKENRDPKKTTNLYPNILYMQQGFASQINLGVYYNQGPVVFGGYFRQSKATSDAFIFLLGIRTQKVKVGFSYDAVVSKVRLGAKQSYEVSLTFEFKKKTPRKAVRNIRCPEF